MKKLSYFFLCLLFFLCPLALQAEKIAEAPSIDSMSKEALIYLQGEDIYQGTLSWQGNKVSTKFNYDKPKKNRQESPSSYD